MSKTVKLILAIVFVAVIVAVALVVNNKDDSSDKNSSSTATTSEDSENSTSSDETTSSSVAVTITYDGNSFSSTADTMKAGETVKVINSSNKALDFDSDPHPAHTDNRELNLGDIAPGESRTFVIDKTGTWGYHNHLDASQNGSITVE